MTKPDTVGCGVGIDSNASQDVPRSLGIWVVLWDYVVCFWVDQPVRVLPRASQVAS